ncbi:MAG: ATP-binding cassette domain-containing protein [Firmicutes bacterium]|nr:ATP-binding cassette domain-containing protein [Bacillota bacterium]
MIEISHVSKTFTAKENNVAAVRDVSLTIRDGEVYGIIGYSGAGKSTLVRCINFLEKPDSGSIALSGFGTVTAAEGKLYFTPEGGKGQTPLSEKKLKSLRGGIGMIFQHFNLLERNTVYENVAYTLKYSGMKKDEIRKRVLEMLDLVDLRDKIASYPSELSGGQKQRVAIARALANNPKILLSDEATSALDPGATASILSLLKDLNKRLGLTIVLITHEMAVVKEICERVAVMEDGAVVEEGLVYDVFADPKQPITRRFVESSNGMGNLQKLVEQNSTLLDKSRNSVLLRCVYGKDAVGDALISDVSRKFAVNMNIVLANVEMLQGSPLGELVVSITGESGNIDEAIAFMRNSGVRVEVIADARVA